MFVCKMYPIFRQIFVYILYTKYLENVCKQNVSHISTNFCINFVYKIQLAQFFWFCIQNVYRSLSKCGIHFAYISCIHLVQFLYTKCMHSFCVGSQVINKQGVKIKMGGRRFLLNLLNGGVKINGWGRNFKKYVNIGNE